ncbi:MAG: hypothetical protein AAFO61_15145, partial [Pseudomonadota bacterium]
KPGGTVCKAAIHAAAINNLLTALGKCHAFGALQDPPWCCHKPAVNSDMKRCAFEVGFARKASNWLSVERLAIECS